MSEDKTFPIQKGYAGDKAAPGPLRIPWSIAEIAYCAYARMYGTGQSLERLAERGGFGLEEMDALYPQWRNEVSEIAVLKQRITGLEHENDALKAQVERLKAPVSDEEMDRFSIHHINVINPFRSLPVLTITQATALIAARAAVPVTESQCTGPFSDDRMCPVHSRYKQTATGAERNPADRLEVAEDKLRCIADWCAAYPLEMFPKPNIKKARALLGDTLFTQLSAYSMRHVCEGIAKIALSAGNDATEESE